MLIGRILFEEEIELLRLTGISAMLWSKESRVYIQGLVLPSTGGEVVDKDKTLECTASHCVAKRSGRWRGLLYCTGGTGGCALCTDLSR